MEWIPVSERLPTEWVVVRVRLVTKDGDVYSPEERYVWRDGVFKNGGRIIPPNSRQLLAWAVVTAPEGE